MSIHIVARKFELKMAQTSAGADIAALKDKRKEEIRKHIADMVALMSSSEEFRSAAFTLVADPFSKFEGDALKGMEDLKQLVSAITVVHNNIDKISLEDIVTPASKAAEAIKSLAASSGTDKWGVDRPNYLNIIEIFGDYFSSMGNYGDPKTINERDKEALLRKLGRVSNVLHYLATHLKNNKRTGVLDILAILSERGLIDKDVVNQPLGKTTRVIVDKQEHENVDILKMFFYYLGLDKLNLMPSVEVLNKYVRPIPGAIDLLRKIKNAWFRTPEIKEKSLRDRPEDPNNLTGIVKNKQLGPETLRKLKLVGAAIAENKKVLDKQEKARSEQMFGTYQAQPMPSKIKPLKNVRELINRLSAEERSMWNKIPTEVQIKVLNNKADLDSALEIAQQFSEHAGPEVGNKLDASLFEGLITEE